MAKQLLKERFQQLAGIKSLSENDRFPGEDEAGMAPRHDRISNPDLLKILQLIKSTGIDPGDVIEAIKMDSPNTNYGLPKIGPSDDNQKGLSDQSDEWLENQINMYFEGGDEPGTPGEQGEFEITRIEQGDSQKYNDADLALEFLEEMRELESIVVRYDDYIGDIKVTSDRDGDAIITWAWPGGE